MIIHNEEIIIIGAGPAGIAAAIQLVRYGFDPLILEVRQVGGLLVNANVVENYPGFPNGVSGPELVGRFQEHLGSATRRVKNEMVTRLDHDGDQFIIRTGKNVHLSRIVVLAPGTSPIHPEIPIPIACRDRVFHEVYPIASCRGKNIVIVGSGDAAFDYALNLSRENRITIINRKSRIKCLPLLLERSRKIESIGYRENVQLDRIQCAQDGLRLAITEARVKSTIETDYLLFAIGREPSLDFLSESMKNRIPALEEEGLLYLIGDVKNGIYRQASIAVGDGIKAAMRIAKIFPEKPR